MVLTVKDIDKLAGVFATKGDLEKFETKEGATQRHNEIMNTLDQLVKEKETAKEDRILSLGKDRQQDGRLDLLESRMGKVEEKVEI